MSKEVVSMRLILSVLSRRGVTLAVVLVTSLVLLSACTGSSSNKQADSSSNKQADSSSNKQENSSSDKADSSSDKGDSSSNKQENSQSSTNQPTVTITKASGARVEVELIDVADTPDKQEKGLKGRTELAEKAGMLFVLEQPRQIPWSSEGAPLALSVADLDERGRIIDILDLYPNDSTTHLSSAPAKYGLMVNQGFFEEQGVKVGDTVEVPASQDQQSPPSNQGKQASQDEQRSPSNQGTQNCPSNQDNQTAEAGQVFELTGQTLILNCVTRDYRGADPTAVPKPGNEYVAANLTVENTDQYRTEYNRGEATASPNNCILQDAGGAQYFSQVPNNDSPNMLPDQKISPGEKVSGNAVFEIPQGASGLTLTCKSTNFRTSTDEYATWTL